MLEIPPFVTSGSRKSDEARADRLGLERRSAPPVCGGLWLQRGPGGLALHGLGTPWSLDLERGAVGRRIATARRTDPLPRAFGLHRRGVQGLRVLDPAAGFLRDAAVLAAMGCQVVAVEAHPVVHWLTEDALARCRARWVHMLQLQFGDGSDALSSSGGAAVFLDPMFPPAAKAAAPGKDSQILRALVGAADGDGDRLLGLALARAGERVVVKRHPHAPPLTGAVDVPPSFAVAGRRVRFDVYLTGANR